MLDVLNVVKFRVACQQVWHRGTTWLIQRTLRSPKVDTTYRALSRTLLIQRVVRSTTWLLQRTVRSPERLVNGSSSGRGRLSSDRSTPTH